MNDLPQMLGPNRDLFNPPSGLKISVFKLLYNDK